jgi:hypothetical protein
LRPGPLTHTIVGLKGGADSKRVELADALENGRSPVRVGGKRAQSKAELAAREYWKQLSLGDREIQDLRLELRLYLERVSAFVRTTARQLRVGAGASGDAYSAGPNGSRRGAIRVGQRKRWLGAAMLTVRDHPEWSDAAIASAVGVNKSQLSRSREYRVAASLARSPKVGRGSVEGRGSSRRIEAEDDSLDPTRRGSRQSEEEESLDERIDREMAATQRTSQRSRRTFPAKRGDGGRS